MVALARGAPGGVFDEEQDVELAEPDGVDDEGVTRNDPTSLRSEELGPGRPATSGGGVGEFAVDTPVAPHRVLSRESDTELFSVAHEARSAGPSLRIGPPDRGEAAVPAKKRVGRDNESAADPPGDDTGEPGDQATVDIGGLEACRGSLQDRDLVTERDDLGFEHPAWFAPNDHQPDDGDEQPVDESAKSGTEVGW